MEQLTNYPSSRTIESPASIEHEGNSAETVVNLPFSKESILTVSDETADLEQMDPLNPKDFHILSHKHEEGETSENYDMGNLSATKANESSNENKSSDNSEPQNMMTSNQDESTLGRIGSVIE